MSFVVIVEPEEVNAERIRAILESVERQFEYELLSSPEQAIDVVENRKPDVFISDMEMPVMTGTELFSMVEILSPDTVRVAMTDVDKIEETIAFMNECRTFKVIIKPCRVADDLITPIESALAYRRMKQCIMQEEMSANMGVFSTEQDYRKMEQTCRENQQNYRRIQNIFTDMLKDNLEFGVLRPEVSEKLKDWYTWMMDAYIKSLTDASGDYRDSVKCLMDTYHNPKAACSFCIRKAFKEKVEAEQMNEMTFMLHLMAGLCKRMLYQYDIKVVIERVPKAYILRFGCTVSDGGKEASAMREKDEEIRNALIRATEKSVDAFGYKSVLLNKGNEVIANLAVGRTAGKNI